MARPRSPRGQPCFGAQEHRHHPRHRGSSRWAPLSRILRRPVGLAAIRQSARVDRCGSIGHYYDPASSWASIRRCRRRVSGMPSPGTTPSAGARFTVYPHQPAEGVRHKLSAFLSTVQPPCLGPESEGDL